MYKQTKKLPTEILADAGILDKNATIWKNKTCDSKKFVMDVIMPYNLWFANINLEKKNIDKEDLLQNETWFVESLQSSDNNPDDEDFKEARKYLIGEIVLEIIFNNRKLYVPELYSKKVRTIKPGEEEFERMFQELLHASNLEHLKTYYWNDFATFAKAIDAIEKGNDEEYDRLVEYLFNDYIKFKKLPEKAKLCLNIIENAIEEGKNPDLLSEMKK